MYFKKTMAVVLLLAVSMMVFASTPYNTIMDAAKANSPQLKNAELNYLNSQLTAKQNDIKDSVKVTVNSGDIEIIPIKNNSTTTTPVTNGYVIEDNGNGTYDITPYRTGEYVTSSTSDANITLNPSVEVVLPNDGNTTIKANIGAAYDFENASYYNYSAGTSASHTFDLVGYDKDVVNDLSNARTTLQSEQTYQQAILAFENQVISSMSNIIKAEKNLFTNKKSLADKETELANKLELGQISESSITYRQSVNSINLLKNTIASLEKQIETAKEQYNVLTGLTWDGVESIPSPSLEVMYLDGGNTAVMLKAIDTEIANENIKAKNAELSPQSIKLSGSVNGNLTSAGDALKASAGVTYNQSNWSVGGSVGGTYANDKFTPTLKIAGSWTNKTSTQSDELALQKLGNNLLSAQNDQISEMTSYTQSMQNLEDQVFAYNFEVEQQNATNEYNAAELEYQKELFAAGLATQADVDDAQFTIDAAEYDNLTLALEGLSLENSIKQLNL